MSEAYLISKEQTEDYNIGDRLKLLNFRVKIEAPHGGMITMNYDSLEEFFEDFDDHKEPEYYWYVDGFGDIHKRQIMVNNDAEASRKQIGNYFNTKEEAEQALEKLKAWKRLKDKGFRFTGVDDNWRNDSWIAYSFDEVNLDDETKKYLDLLFSSEDD